MHKNPDKADHSRKTDNRKQNFSESCLRNIFNKGK